MEYDTIQESKIYELKVYFNVFQLVIIANMDYNKINN